MRTANLIDAKIQLHGIARLIECEIGIGSLSEDIRKCADRLSVLLKPLVQKKEAV